MIQIVNSSARKRFGLVPAVIVGWTALIATQALAHDSCPDNDPTPDHPATHPHCDPDKPGGNGNGGEGNTEDITGTEFDDGGGPDANDPPGCVDPSTAIYGTSGDDSILGLGGNDCLYGKGVSDIESGNDSFHGGDGDNWMQGGPGNDAFGGGQGFDVMLGEDGNDVFFAAGDADYVDGGGGWDLMNFNVNGSELRVNWDGITHPVSPAPAVVRKCDAIISGSYAAHTITDVFDPLNPIVDEVFNIEDIIGTPHDDVIFGSDADEAASPRRGDDCLDLGGGNDLLLPGRGNDFLIGGSGSDIMRGGPNSDEFHFYDADFTDDDDGVVDVYVDIIEDFSNIHDCIDLHDIPTVTTMVTVGPGDGGSNPDTIIEVEASDGNPGTIRLWDVVDVVLGCPGP